MRSKFHLGVMMFLQYAIWGAWAPVLSAYLLGDLGFSGTQVGWIYALLPIANILAPFLGGQIADRYFPTERVIAALQLSGGVLLILASQAATFTSMAAMMFVYCLLYAPTLALTNAIAMINLDDSESEFGGIRVWGTIGWIVAGLALSGWRFIVEAGAMPAIAGDTLLLAGLLSLVMGVQSFGLPHTPPRKEGVSPWAFLEALKMLRDPNFATFVGICFVVATELQFYYVLTAPFLQSPQIGLSAAAVPGTMVIAQIAEIFVMAFLLSRFLRTYGMRTTLALGVIAWPIRYVIFAVGQPAWLVIASLTLHGFCYVFFFTAAFIYVDRVAPRDIRASAQSLIAIVILGVGSAVGSVFAGWIQSFFTEGGATDWTAVFLVPCALTVLCAVAFLVFFREERQPLQVEAGAPGADAG